MGGLIRLAGLNCVVHMTRFADGEIVRPTRPCGYTDAQITPNTHRLIGIGRRCYVGFVEHIQSCDDTREVVGRELVMHVDATFDDLEAAKMFFLSEYVR